MTLYEQPKSWEEVEQALEEDRHVQDHDGDTVIELKPHSSGNEEWRRVIYRDRNGDINGYGYLGTEAALSAWRVEVHEGPTEEEVAEALRSIAQTPAPPVSTITPPVVSRDGVVQLILTDDLFNHVKRDLERRGLTVNPYRLNDPDDVDTYTVGIGQALWERS